MTAILFNGAEPMANCQHPLDRRLYMKSLKIGQEILEKKTFKDYKKFLHVYSQRARADKP